MNVLETVSPPAVFAGFLRIGSYRGWRPSRTGTEPYGTQPYGEQPWKGFTTHGEQRHPRLVGYGQPRRRPGPRAGDGRGAEGGVRSPGHGDEPGARRLSPLPGRAQARPGRPEVAGPGQVRALLRALVADPLHPAVPVGLRPHA